LLPNDIFTILPYSKGNIGYLAFSGELPGDELFGSCSTHLMAGFGGFHGRRLQKGDVLELKNVRDVDPGNSIPFEWNNSPIRIWKGPEWERLGMGDVHFETLEFEVGRNSDRSGIRLVGAPLKNTGQEMQSVPVAEGTIQLTTGGMPIVLMADGPTTGGYPRIGQVLTEDLGRLAQKRPGERLSFRIVN
jgi:5-oxoprolinase (ATP-hydrolysing) subunit C